MCPPESDKEHIDDTLWRKIIGDKIICSECKNRAPRAFDFSVVEWSEWAIFIRCMKCQHKGEYHPSEDEVRSYKKAMRKKEEAKSETNWALEA